MASLGPADAPQQEHLVGTEHSDVFEQPQARQLADITNASDLGYPSPHSSPAAKHRPAIDLNARGSAVQPEEPASHDRQAAVQPDEHGDCHDHSDQPISAANAHNTSTAKRLASELAETRLLAEEPGRDLEESRVLSVSSTYNLAFPHLEESQV